MRFHFEDDRRAKDAVDRHEELESAHRMRWAGSNAPCGVVLEGRLQFAFVDSFRSCPAVATLGRRDSPKRLTPVPVWGLDAGHQFGIGPRTGLLAKPKPGDCRAVPLDVLAGQVRQQAAALSNEFEKSPPGVEVVFVGAQVISQTVDSLSEERNLNLGRTGIIRMCAKLGDDRLFLLAL